MICRVCSTNPGLVEQPRIFQDFARTFQLPDLQIGGCPTEKLNSQKASKREDTAKVHKHSVHCGASETTGTWQHMLTAGVMESDRIHSIGRREDDGPLDRWS